MRIKKPKVTCERVCLLIIAILIVTPFIALLWPKGPHWEYQIRDPPTLLWTTNSTLNGSFTYGVAIGNVDSDPQADIVTTEQSWQERVSRIMVREGDTGEIKWYHEFDIDEMSDIALGNLDEDTPLEIVCSVDTRGVFAFDGNGTMLWSYVDGTLRTSVFIPPVITDVLGNPSAEIVMPSSDGEILILNGSTGEHLWSMELGNAINHAIAVGDIDCDHHREIVVNCENDYTYALNPGNETPIWFHHWSHEFDWLSTAPPIICDINGNGVSEVVVATSESLTVLDGIDGTVVWSFPKNLGDIDPPKPIAIADLDGDGQLEVLFTVDGYYLYALRGRDGSILWTFNGFGLDEFFLPCIGDFDEDDRLEILITTMGASVVALNAEDASTQWARSMDSEGIRGQFPPSVGDIDQDDGLEIVVPCYGDYQLYAIRPVSSGNRTYWNPHAPTNGCSQTLSVEDFDQDLDGLSDSFESSIGTNVLGSDSDMDAFPDAWEYYHGFDPLNPHVPWDEYIMFNAVPIALMVVGVVSLSGILFLAKRAGWFSNESYPMVPEPE